jgi:hypothetical protein
VTLRVMWTPFPVFDTPKPNGAPGRVSRKIDVFFD